MSAYDLAAIFASTTVVTTGIAAFLRWGRPKWRQRQADRAQLRALIHGRPVIRDEQNNIIDPGEPALSKKIADQRAATTTILEQLTPNGGSSIADQITRIDRITSDLRHHQQEIETTVNDSSDRIAEARVLASEAATIADRVEQQHTDDLAQINAKIDAIDSKVADLSAFTHNQLAEAELRAQAMRDIAIELGMPWPSDEE